MRIPEVRLHGAEIGDAIGFLVESGGKHNEYGMSVILMDPVDDTVQITIQAENTSFFHVLDEICQQSGMYWKIDGKVVVITSDQVERGKGGDSPRTQHSDSFRESDPFFQ